MNKIIFVNAIISFVVITTITVFFTHTFVLADAYVPTKAIVKYENVQIHEGDCLSVIAEKYNTSNMSTKEFTKYVKEFNNLKNDTIYFGNSILIPIFEK